jgi:transposase-like protein
MANRRWTMEQKRHAVERMKVCGHDKLAGELKIQRRQLYAWRAQLGRLDRGLSKDTGSRKDLERENRHLKEVLANKVLEVEFFKGALRRIEARRRQSGGTGGTAFTNRCE